MLCPCLVGNIGSPTFGLSPSILKSFDDHTFQPYVILTKFPIELGRNTILVEVDVVNAPLDYILLPENTWFYAMKVVVSSVF